MDWWDQGKFYLREVTRSYSRSKAADQRSRKTSLMRQMNQLKRSFDQGDRTAFGKLCEVQQELRGIALHEARGAQVRARCQWDLSRRRRTRHMHDVTCVIETVRSRAARATLMQTQLTKAPHARTPKRVRCSVKRSLRILLVFDLSFSVFCFYIYL